MEDTIQVGAHFSQDRSDTDPDRGDIVIVGLPAGGESLMRVIALPSETIESRGGHIYVNGHLLDEPYVKNGDSFGMAVDFTRLESNEYFVMYDNRIFNLDSRSFGPITDIRATVTGISNP